MTASAEGAQHEGPRRGGDLDIAHFTFSWRALDPDDITSGVDASRLRISCSASNAAQRLDDNVAPRTTNGNFRTVGEHDEKSINSDALQASDRRSAHDSGTMNAKKLRWVEAHLEVLE